MQSKSVLRWDVFSWPVASVAPVSFLWAPVTTSAHCFPCPQNQGLRLCPSLGFPRRAARAPRFRAPPGAQLAGSALSPGLPLRTRRSCDGPSPLRPRVFYPMSHHPHPSARVTSPWKRSAWSFHWWTSKPQACRSGSPLQGRRSRLEPGATLWARRPCRSALPRKAAYISENIHAQSFSLLGVHVNFSTNTVWQFPPSKADTGHFSFCIYSNTIHKWIR